MEAPSGLDRTVIVIVDDDPDVLSSLKFALELEGFEVRAYASAEALLMEGGLPERGCLVLDQHLSGMDGLDLLERLREGGCRLPAVVITTPNPGVRARAAQVGAPIIEKPMVVDALISEVARVMQG